MSRAKLEHTPLSLLDEHYDICSRLACSTRLLWMQRQVFALLPRRGPRSHCVLCFPTNDTSAGRVIAPAAEQQLLDSLRIRPDVLIG